MPEENKLHEYADKFLTPPQKLWLETLWKKIKEGKTPTERELAVELRGKASDEGIRGAFKRGVNITIFGIALVDPENDLIKTADSVIQAVRTELSENPDKKTITAKEISKKNNLTEADVEDIFKRLSYLGMFHNSGVNGSFGGWGEINIDDRVFNEYLKFENIQEALESLLPKDTFQYIELGDFDNFADRPMAKTENRIDARKVFVVHGRNHQIKDAVCGFLRSINLDPMEWSEARSLTEKTTPYVGEILKAGLDNAQAILVLFTPDDLAKLSDEFVSDDDDNYEKDFTPQPRQNVTFEAGMAMAMCPERTVLVQIGKVRPMSDISGLHIIRLNNSTPVRQELAERLKTAGCDVITANRTAWHTEGNFEIKSTHKSNSNHLLFFDSKYYETDINNKPIGEPFCPRCYEAEGKRIHLQQVEENYFRCANCRQFFGRPKPITSSSSYY